MGVNAVVIVKNRTGLPLVEFEKQLERDEWGRFAVTRVGDCFMWEAYVWKGVQYLSWLSGPKFRYLGFGDAVNDVDSGHGDGPNPDNAVQLTFLKAMLALERITGGPVSLGVDVINFRTPEMAHELGDEFWLPIALDDWIVGWRMVDRMTVQDPILNAACVPARLPS